MKERPVIPFGTQKMVRTYLAPNKTQTVNTNETEIGFQIIETEEDESNPIEDIINKIEVTYFWFPIYCFSEIE
jgi:hypothetical protein